MQFEVNLYGANSNAIFLEMASKLVFAAETAAYFFQARVFPSLVNDRIFAFLANIFASKTFFAQSYKLRAIASKVKTKSACPKDRSFPNIGFKFPFAMLCNNSFTLPSGIFSVIAEIVFS